MKGTRWLTSVLVLVATAGCAGGDNPARVPDATMSGQTAPPTAAHRIAAEYGGAGTFLPSRVPTGFAFSRWWTASDCGPCGFRLVVHFVRPHSDLKWETFFPEQPIRRPDCRHQAYVVGVIDGRKVSYRRRRGAEMAWICLPAHYHETVVVSHRLGRGDGVTARDLERMVASARPQPPGRADGRRYELPSHAATRAMTRTYRAPFFLPRSLPRGFVFTGWRVNPPDFAYEKRHTLLLWFGRDGTRLRWTVLSGVDPYGDCPRDHYAQRTFRSHGRLIFFGAGIHGATAHTCLAPHAVGNPRPLDVELWYDIRLDGKKMRRRAVRMVATARLFRP
jgi:hypothetical protein